MTCLQPCMVSGRWYSPPGIASTDLGYLVPLTILSKCFTGILSTISETEFYTAQQPLPFKELYNDDKLGLLDLLRTSLFQVDFLLRQPSHLMHLGWHIASQICASGLWPTQLQFILSNLMQF